MEKDMTAGTPGKIIFNFTMPIFIGNIFQQFYNMADTVIVGKFVGNAALAAVGACGTLVFLIIGFLQGVTAGFTVVTAQHFGAGNMKAMKKSVASGAVLTGIVTVILTLLSMISMAKVLHLMNTPSDMYGEAYGYIMVICGGIVAQALYNYLASVLRALGDSKRPLYFLVIAAFLNIVLDLVFVISFGWGVAGVAVATLIAQGVSAVISFVILMLKVRKYHSEGHFQLYDGGMVLGMLKVAVPSTLQQSIVHIGMLLVQSVINGFGSSIMAGYAAATRIESISIVPMLAIGNAMSTFTAQNMGAGQPERVRTGYRYGAMMVGVSAVILCVLLQLFGDTFIMAFLDPESGAEAFRTGVSYVNFISFFFVFIGLKATTDGLLRGAGDVLVFTIANLVNLTIRVFVAFQFAPIWGPQAVWFAIPMGWAANYLISLARYLTGRWSRIKMVG